MKLTCFLICAACIVLAAVIWIIDIWGIVDFHQYHFKLFWTCGIVGLASFGIGTVYSMFLDKPQEQA